MMNDERPDILAGAEDKRTDPIYEGNIGYIPFAYHILPIRALAKTAAVMRAGERSGREPDSWRTVPIEEQLNHAISHLMAYLAGRHSEHHLANACCRVMMALDMDTLEALPVPAYVPKSFNVFEPSVWPECPQEEKTKGHP